MRNFRIAPRSQLPVIIPVVFIKQPMEPYVRRLVWRIEQLDAESEYWKRQYKEADKLAVRNWRLFCNEQNKNPT